MNNWLLFQIAKSPRKARRRSEAIRERSSLSFHFSLDWQPEQLMSKELDPATAEQTFLRPSVETLQGNRGFVFAERVLMKVHILRPKAMQFKREELDDRQIDR